MIRSLLKPLVSLCAAAAITVGVAAATRGEEPKVCRCDQTLDRRQLGEFDLRTYTCDPDDDARFMVWWQGKPVHVQQGFSLKFHPDGPELGSDLNGDGLRDVAVFEWTGGAHGHYRWHLFTFGDEQHLDAFAPLATIEASFDRGEFEDLDGDGTPEWVGRDWTFAYWRDYSFAQAAAPQVVLRWRDGGYHVANDLMQVLPPSHETIARRAQALAADPAWGERGDPPAALLDDFLGLLYGGQAGAAWQLVAAAWPQDRPGRAEFELALLGQLSRSPYWLEVDVSGGRQVPQRTTVQASSKRAR